MIDEWAMTPGRGRHRRARREYFAIPSVAENGGIWLEIENAGDARLLQRVAALRRRARSGRPPRAS